MTTPTPYRFRAAKDNVSTGYHDQVWLPRTIRGATKYPVILLHGANAATVLPRWDWNNTSFPSVGKLAAVLASEGIPCIAAAMDGNHYAKDIVVQAGGAGYINKALAYIAAQSGCSASKAHVIGLSMGGGTGVRWAGLNYAAAASVTGLIPMASPFRLYTENPNQLVASNQSFTYDIATAWGLTNLYRSDCTITNGSPTITSPTGGFTAGHNGYTIVRGYDQPGIPANTTVTYVNATTLTMNKNATASVAGTQRVVIAAPLPMSGATGLDLTGYYAPILAAHAIPNRFFYASDDAFITPADVTALAAAAGGTAVNLGAVGHANPAGVALDTYNGGTDFSDLVAWLKANGA